MALDEIAHYRVTTKLGEGGMGEVYLAEDTRLDRKVALKLLPEQFTQDEGRVRRFVQEAKAASALNHPNIITIFEIGRTDRRHYISTEYIEGETLRQKLSRGPLAVDETLDVAIQVAGALAAAHKAGVIHRDIKPENVMARGDDIVKVLDFGLAKLTERRYEAPVAVDNEAPNVARVHTNPGVVMGTVGYMAPEQVRGLEVDARADVFSLGVILYEMLTGRAPFGGETPSDVIVALLEKEPPPIARLAPDSPAELRHIVNKALRKDREDRYQSVKSMLADLKALKQELEFAANLERNSSREMPAGSRRASGAAAAGLPEAEESDGLDLAHVLFCDIVGYSLLPIDQQTQMMRRLQEIVRQTEAYRRAEAGHQLVRLPAGDGMALAFLNDLSAPVRCAFEIARALKSHPEIRLRMGVHTGPVFRSADINANRNVVGSGINMAQRVMDCGDAGHILVSRNVAEALGQVSRWQSYLHDLGEVEVKHGVRLRLSNLYDDEIGNPETPAKVMSQGAAAGAPPPETKSSAEYLVGEIRKHKRGVALWLAVTLALVGGAGYWFFARSGSGGAIDSLAVLPFQYRGGAADSEYLSDGLVESLIYRLSQLPNLKVSPTSSVFRYKDKDTDPLKIGGDLGVQAVMSGRMAQRGENLTISVELVDVHSRKTLWGEQYERRLSDLLATQREIATEITQRLRLRLTGEGERKLAKKYTNSNDAYQLYLKGRFHWAKRVKDDILKSIEYYKQAIEIDPNFALAYAGIAESYNSMGKNPDLPPGEAIPKAKAARALEIDPSLAEAHSAFADSLAIYDWNWAESEREFKRAIELDPNVSYIHLSYGISFLTAAGTPTQIVREVERALELEPLSLISNSILVSSYLYGRQNEKALQQARKAYDLDPAFPLARLWLGEAYIANGRQEDAIALGEGGLQSEPANPAFLYFLGHAYAKSGRPAEAQRAVDKFREVGKTRYARTYYLACIYAALGDKDKAFAELEKSFVDKDCFLPRMKNDPLMDPLRDDPRFNSMLKRLNLPE